MGSFITPVGPHGLAARGAQYVTGSREDTVRRRDADRTSASSLSSLGAELAGPSPLGCPPSMQLGSAASSFAVVAHTHTHARLVHANFNAHVGPGYSLLVLVRAAVSAGCCRCGLLAPWP